MELKIIPVGPFAVNCALVFFPDTGVLLIVDPGAEAEKIVAAARKYPFKSARILLTHAHVDHISGAGAVARALNVPNVELNPGDHPIYRSPDNSLEPYYPAPSDLPPVAPVAPGAATPNSLARRFSSNFAQTAASFSGSGAPRR